MRFSTIAMAAAATGALAADDSLCGKYTTALLKENTGANQYMLLQLLVNRVVTGATAEKTNSTAVAGILAKGEVNGTEVNLLPYFDGTLASTNRNNKAVAVNFLADGGATPLTASPPKPADSENSPQYFLLTHLYSFFGALLGCSEVGKDGFPGYMGNPSMASVHRFMDLSDAENTYFIQQVGAAAASFGVTEDDVNTVAKSLIGAFNMRCSPAVDLLKTGTAELQAICQAEDCPLSPSADCSAYPDGGAVTSPTPAPASSGTPTPSGSSTPSGTPTGTGAAPSGTGAASALTISAGAGIFGFIAAVLAL